jgi:hypothetical protein
VRIAPGREALGAKRWARKKSPEGLDLSFHFFMLALKVKENCACKCDAKNKRHNPID